MASNESIVTGHWGCGKFGGDKRHKFVQQVLAASAANRKLDYSVFGEDHTLNEFNQLLNYLENRPLLEIWQHLLESRSIEELLGKLKGEDLGTN